MKIEVLENGFMPEKAHEDDAGYDIRSAEELTLNPGQSLLVKAGFKMMLPKNMEAQVRSRSGWANKHQIIVLNSPGTIDPGYRGEVGVILANLGAKAMKIERGDRIAQMVFAKFESPEITEGKVTEKSNRGEGGFGSTGEK